jgi:transcription initiation factor TFIID subunit 5
MTGHYSTIYALAFHPEGRILASAGDDAKIILWDLGSGRKIKTLTGHIKPIWSLDFSQDGSVLASGSADNTVRIWNTAGVCSTSGSCSTYLQRSY